MKRLWLLLILLAILVMPMVGQFAEAHRRYFLPPPPYPYPYGYYHYHYPYHYPVPVVVWGCQVREKRCVEEPKN